MFSTYSQREHREQRNTYSSEPEYCVAGKSSLSETEYISLLEREKQLRAELQTIEEKIFDLNGYSACLRGMRLKDIHEIHDILDNAGVERELFYEWMSKSLKVNGIRPDSCNLSLLTSSFAKWLKAYQMFIKYGVNHITAKALTDDMIGHECDSYPF